MSDVTGLPLNYALARKVLRSPSAYARAVARFGSPIPHDDGRRPDDSFERDERLYPGYVTGYRSWTVETSQSHGLAMLGENGRSRWPVGEAMRARCRTELARSLRRDPRNDPTLPDPYMDYPHEAPDLECGWCGIYALKRPEADGDDAVVHGQVRLWGRVIEHERGYRGELAYPSLLYNPPGGRLVPAIAELYRIPWEDAR